MENGMMWFDNDPRKSLEVKVRQAAEYYRNKYGSIPNMCMVNPLSLANAGAQAADSIAIKPLRSVLPGHLWIGREESAALPSVL